MLPSFTLLDPTATFVEPTETETPTQTGYPTLSPTGGPGAPGFPFPTGGFPFPTGGPGAPFPTGDFPFPTGGPGGETTLATVTRGPRPTDVPEGPSGGEDEQTGEPAGWSEWLEWLKGVLQGGKGEAAN